ncbi:MAG TPA: macro domain-containing protein [Thermoanaerobaculia bacterium]|nr:macro domain-containing protein [Thermoanaerobaculia bacterium]
MAVKMNDTLLDLVEGDITELEVDAIVNSASSDLKLTGGVGKAILAKGGRSIQSECKRIGSTPVGTAVMTGAGKLPVKQVIHAVGPRAGEGDEDRKLASAVRSALALADRNGLRSIAIPAISAGASGFPLDRCARILLTEVHRYLQGGTKLETVIVVLHGEDNYKTFRRELRRGFR